MFRFSIEIYEFLLMFSFLFKSSWEFFWGIVVCVLLFLSISTGKYLHLSLAEILMNKIAIEWFSLGFFFFCCFLNKSNKWGLLLIHILMHCLTIIFLQFSYTQLFANKLQLYVNQFLIFQNLVFVFLLHHLFTPLTGASFFPTQFLIFHKSIQAIDQIWFFFFHSTTRKQNHFHFSGT